ncbi:hypothetical protein NKN81_004421 [Salmonella enterica]|nr:hypothetical protein [Salmonella enterica]
MSICNRVLECPECAERVQRPEQLMLPLFPLQQAILEGTLAKKRVSQIARVWG